MKLTAENVSTSEEDRYRQEHSSDTCIKIISFSFIEKKVFNNMNLYDMEKVRSELFFILMLM